MNQFVYAVVELGDGGVVGQELTYFFLRETCHLVELIAERVVGSDIEATCQIVQGYRTYTRNEHSLDGGIGTCFDGVEEIA